uniref:hypothetical protein n=1 Tax=Vibrio diabolicus TaxID=50719 RepID=UPI001EEFD530
GLSIKKGLTPGRRRFLDLVRPLICQQSPVIAGFCLLIERFVNKLITGLSIKKGLTPGRRRFLDLVRPLICQQSPVIAGFVY